VYALTNRDTLQRKIVKDDRINFLVYCRIISDSRGNVRVDENVVPNFKLNKWLRFEFGLRQGERSQKFDSYYHYKAEIQTKSFWKTVRFIARLSDNVIKYPSPDYSKSNYLIIAESKWQLSRDFLALVAGGYVFSYQKNNSIDATPLVNQGDKSNYPTFKVALRYLLNEKGYIEAVYGAYDVFNPYLLSSPFLQLSLEYEITEHCDLYSYYRYQYNNSIGAPLNDFLGIGVKLHLKN
jgi:hypothetical protein